MADLPPGDWAMWAVRPPSAARSHVEAWCMDWGQVRIIEPSSLPPATDIADLWWRPLDHVDGELFDG